MKGLGHLSTANVVAAETAPTSSELQPPPLVEAPQGMAAPGIEPGHAVRSKPGIESRQNACRVYVRPSAAPGRIDVLVEAKQVVRVVASLQLDEPLVVHAESLAHSVVVVGR